ncbi:scm-like with four MBT domains protein 1 [Tetranychus urticae]|nr:scm-like with four MBT domains protein 1 [Tetranychus urticae]
MDSSQENNNSNITMANDSDEAEKEPLEDEEEEELDEDLVSEDAFWHIEASWLSGFEAGMNIEIEHEDKKFWPAQITNAFSNLLSIRWSGSSADSWFDVKANKCYPHGYLKDKQGYSLEPPEKVQLSDEDKDEIISKYAKGEKPADEDDKPLSLYVSGGLNPSSVFKAGVMLEISHRLDPDKHWFAEVKKNVGGRLLVKWAHNCEKEPDAEPSNPVEFWIFYSHPRVHHLGYAKEKGDISYESVFLYNSWVTDIAKYLSSQDNEITLTVKYLLKLAKARRPPIMEESSIKNSQVSDLALTFPSDLGKLVPVIIQSKGDDYLIVSSQSKKWVSCYPNDDNMTLLPSSWAEEHGGSLYNFEDATNDSSDYLSKNKANEAPIKLVEDERIHKFKVNHKLQVVHPHDRTKICDGIVSRLTPPLVWVEISSDLVAVLPYNSTDLFPSGFCEDNSYTLTKLLTAKNKKPTKKRNDSNGDQETSDKSLEAKSTNIPPELVPSRSRDVCPRIYFNHKCFTGPLLSKTKIRELPRFVGPGPVILVMQEVIAKIISVAYVPPRVLNEMSSRAFDELLSKHNIVATRTNNFKAKWQKKAFRDEIFVVTNNKDVADYCKIVCNHLKCCYHLFGPDLYDGDDCPSHCRGLRKTNKVLKRAIYYRQKAAKTKTGTEPIKPAGSPSSSGTKEVESSENIEPGEQAEENQEDKEIKNKKSKETKEEKVKQGKTSPSGRAAQPVTRKSSTSSRKPDDENSRENSQENSQEKCPSEKSNGDFREESPTASMDNFRETTNLGREKHEEKTYDRAFLRSNKRKYEDLLECTSSNGSENSLDQRSQPNANLEKDNKRTRKPGRKAQKAETLSSLIDLNDRFHPVNWSTSDVYNYFRDNSCYTLSETLYEHEIDGLALLLLDNKSQWMNLLLGFSRKNNLDDVTKLAQIIRKLKSRYFPGASQSYIQLTINKVSLQRQTRKSN